MGGIRDKYIGLSDAHCLNRRVQPLGNFYMTTDHAEFEEKLLSILGEASQDPRPLTGFAWYCSDAKDLRPDKNLIPRCVYAHVTVSRVERTCDFVSGARGSNHWWYDLLKSGHVGCRADSGCD